jgi:hypothetical protein
MFINKPNYIKLPTDQNQTANGYFPTGITGPAGAFSTEGVEQLIKGKGFLVKHYKYALSPNRTSMEGGVDISSEIGKKSFNYYDPHDLYVDIQQLSWTDTYMQQGIYSNFQVATLNYCAAYEDAKDMRSFLRVNDILVAMNDITVMSEQLIEYNGRTHLRLMLPITSVDYLADSTRRYYQDTDFTICDGQIEWIEGGIRPSFANGKGAILSVVYWTKPYFQVVGTPRCFRAVFTNQLGNANQPTDLTYFPGNAVVKMLWSTRIDFDLPGWAINNIPQQGLGVK